MKKLFNYHTLLICVLSLPALLGAGWILAALQPDSLYYGVLNGSVGIVPLNLPFIILVVMFVLGAGAISLFIKRQKKPFKSMLWVAVLLAIVGADILLAGVSMLMPRKFYPGHEYCQDRLIAKTLRCEGANKGFMQDRLNAVARFGIAVDDLRNKMGILPDYDLVQTDCRDLPGGFGQACYSGNLQASTGDTYFMNIYISGDKILVLETVNVAINQPRGDGPVFAQGHEPKLSDFLRIERFARDMTP